MPFEHAKKIGADAMPQPAHSRTVTYRYPWGELAPGEGFIFAPSVKISSARVMCANNGRDMDRIFRCYRGVDEKLYCIRMASFHAALPAAAKEAEAPRFTAGALPSEMKEVIGDYGAANGRITPDSMAIIPPEVRSAPDAKPRRVLNAELIRQQMNAEREKNEDDVI